ncbi:hypothetical protein GGR56DRAFT_156234 [Xylariaceae sp. FL0804]|nr:hypothetical protein GGR56DRAFT_156234 [Xylariaceae sp. FL0804]
MDEMDDSLGQLEYYASGLATAVRNLTHQIRSSHIEAGRAPRAISDSQHTEEVKQARRSVLSQITAIQTLLCSPTDVLQQLAYQSQLLACLQWLGENQILACIPRVGHLPIKNIADLAGVSEPLLSRVVRFVTTRGFLLEDPPGHIAHTALSDQFFSNPLLLDAAMFMAESAAPAALKMARLSEDSEPSAFNLALGITTPFKTLCDERPRLRRQFSAYLYYASGLHMGVDTFTATLTQLDWNNITNSLVVEVSHSPCPAPAPIPAFTPPSHPIISPHHSTPPFHPTIHPHPPPNPSSPTPFQPSQDIPSQDVPSQDVPCSSGSTAESRLMRIRPCRS